MVAEQFPRGGIALFRDARQRCLCSVRGFLGWLAPTVSHYTSIPGAETGNISKRLTILVAIAIDSGYLKGWFPLARLPRIFRHMVDHIDEAATEFIWKKGKSLISLTRSGDSWTVQYQTASRLLGPRQCQYQATHRHAKFAAWDVMARVIGACHDEDEGLEVGLRAAQWMRRADSSSVASA